MRTCFLVSLLLLGCSHSPWRRGSVLPALDVHWKTMRAEHHVELDVTKADGTHDKRKLRGALAARMPDAFRLRALGPAGITLFDLLYVDGRVKVMEAIKDPKASALGAVIQALAGDVSTALVLGPRFGARPVTIEGDTITIENEERIVRLSRFIQQKAPPHHVIATRIDIENKKLHYKVGVDVTEVELNEPLDPALFAE